MSMTTAYLLNKCTPINPVVGKDYRVIGFQVSGAIYKVEKIENDICYFKGYVMPKQISKLKFYEIQ